MNDSVLRHRFSPLPIVFLVIFMLLVPLRGTFAAVVCIPDAFGGVCLPCGVWVCGSTIDAGKSTAAGVWSGSVAQKIAQWTSKFSQWANENLDSAFSLALKKAGAMAESETKTASAQAKIIGKRQNNMAAVAGEISADHDLSMAPNSCATTLLGQGRSQAAQVTGSALESLVRYSNAVGVGENADAGSASFVAYEVNDLCQLGFLDISSGGRYGELPSNMNCEQPPDTRYIDADLNIGSVLDALQFPLPEADRVYRTRDGHVFFSPPPAYTGSGSGTPVSSVPAAPYLGSELDFAAAYKFCEHLRVPIVAPTHNKSTHPSIQDIINIKMDRDNAAARSMAETECWRALVYRMSCPKGSLTSLEAVGNGESCHQAQQALCNRLVGDRAKGGLGLTFQDANGKDTHPVYASALRACADPAVGGISLAMFDAIMAHRCEDNNFAQLLPAVLGGDAERVERAISFECPQFVDSYEQKMMKERRLLQQSIGSLQLVREFPQAGSGARTSQ